MSGRFTQHARAVARRAAAETGIDGTTGRFVYPKREPRTWQDEPPTPGRCNAPCDSGSRRCRTPLAQCHQHRRLREELGMEGP